MSIFGESELNKAQLQAVHHDGGPLLLLAGVARRLAPLSWPWR